MSAIIETVALTKWYGKHRGITELDLEVPADCVFGFLGPNGAGKTTTMRLLMDFIRPTSGKALVFGLDSRADSQEIRSRVGYLPGELALYERMTAWQLLEHLASLRGLADFDLARELVERLELRPDRRIGQLSKGNKQKVGLIQALMHRPELAILDEPTSGLDPIMQREFHAIMRELRALGTTFFLSSHVLDEVRRIADLVGVIGEGRLLTVKDMQDLEPLVTLDFRFGESVPPDIFDGIPGVERVELDNGTASVDVVGSVDAVLRAATAHEVLDLRSTEADLEGAFMRHVKETAHAP